MNETSDVRALPLAMATMLSLLTLDPALGQSSAPRASGGGASRAADAIAPVSVSMSPSARANQSGPAARLSATGGGPTVPLAVAALDSRAQEPPPPDGASQFAPGGLLYVPEPPPRSFAIHDLITIVVSEQSTAASQEDTKTEKDYSMNAAIDAWMNMDFGTLDEQVSLDGEQLPEFAVGGNKEFDVKGKYKRRDDLTAKITAEVIDVLPNGTLVLEAWKHIKTDNEEQTIRLTGNCRPDDVDVSNSVQSNRLAHASIEKVTRGQLRDANDKGIIAKVLDTIFAF